MGSGDTETGEVVVDLADGWTVRREDEPAGPGESGAAAVTVPHTVVPLSWHAWDPATWEHRWVYERELALPARLDAEEPGRWWLKLDGVTSAVEVTVDGVPVGSRLGAYLPSRFDVTDRLTDRTGALRVVVDARATVDTPPNDVELGSSVVDYWQPGGIYRAVRLRRVPVTRIADVVVRPVDVLDPARRRLDVVVTTDGPLATGTTTRVELLDAAGEHLLAVAELPATAGDQRFTLHGLAAVCLWDVDDPALYTVRVSLVRDGVPVHTRHVRTGFREAVFGRDGFRLNGRRLTLRGANRHQLFPWAGFALGDRAQRRDARILREELNCVMVRCSHYPPSAAFLDACDELGLLVWEEAPGWQHLGGPAWRERACRDVEEMVRRDRHRPSVVVWGVRLNEMPDDRTLWSRTEEIAKRLDPTRATSGSMHEGTRDSVDFQHDVFAYDDYSTETFATPTGGEDRRPVLLPPREPWPYLLAEAVSQRSSPTGHYRRTDPSAVLEHQALDYAAAFDAVAADDRYAGLLAWVGFDYQTAFPGESGVKFCGLADTFRILKPGAAFHRSQVDPAVRPVLEPAFGWGSGPGAQVGPGAGAVVGANVDRIEAHVGGELHAVALPDHAGFPHLAHPPFRLDLPAGGDPLPDLRLDGYLGGELVISRSFGGDPAADRLDLRADDAELVADGVDATRVVVGTVDRHGNPRLHAAGTVSLSVDGPASLVGPDTLDLAEFGGSAAVWVRTRPGQAGRVTVRATRGGQTAECQLVVRPDGSRPGDLG